jgi:hypothetical protein
MTREQRAEVLRSRFKACGGIPWPVCEPRVPKPVYRPRKGGSNCLNECEPELNIRRCPEFFRKGQKRAKPLWIKRNRGPSVLGRIAQKLNRKLPRVLDL